MSNASNVMLIWRQQSRLAKQIERPGGISKGDAIAKALENIEALRAEYVAHIGVLIEQAEAITATRSADAFHQLLRIGDTIISLSGTYCFHDLCGTAKHLCDLLSAFIERNETDWAPVAVHVRALRLFAPGSIDVGEISAQKVLLELRKILTHFEIEDAEVLWDAGSDPATTQDYLAPLNSNRTLRTRA
ncbi:MAG TPA: hypothetical protein VHL34_20250 [Rhizomicrobium sp.]|jgi:hypothetical protein|nr:hypothetical protein [Rhizomicrobium sp.]